MYLRYVGIIYDINFVNNKYSNLVLYIDPAKFPLLCYGLGKEGGKVKKNEQIKVSRNDK